jgi:hypothetical protein
VCVCVCGARAPVCVHVCVFVCKHSPVPARPLIFMAYLRREEGLKTPARPRGQLYLVCTFNARLRRVPSLCFRQLQPYTFATDNSDLIL